MYLSLAAVLYEANLIASKPSSRNSWTSNDKSSESTELVVGRFILEAAKLRETIVTFLLQENPELFVNVHETVLYCGRSCGLWSNSTGT